MTRQQQDLTAALEHVEELTNAHLRTRKTYGSLCHSFPILVRTNGLCQTLAFFHERRSSDEQDKPGLAYQRLWSHIAATLGQDEQGLLGHVRSSTNACYLFDTRRIMEAWVYYKRFAVSILDVKAGEEPQP